jgi:hypothetical protein
LALQATAGRLGLTLHREALDFYERATAAQFAYIDRLRASAEARRYYREVALELAFAHMIADAPEAEAERLRRARERWDGGEVMSSLGRRSAPGTQQTRSP